MNFIQVGNFPIGYFQEIVAGMRTLLLMYNQLATASAANNVVNMQQADEAVLQLVKETIDKLTATMGKDGQKAANS